MRINYTSSPFEHRHTKVEIILLHNPFNLIFFLSLQDKE